LGALAKELKLKTNGKQMLAALDKAGLIQDPSAFFGVEKTNQAVV